MNEHLNLLAKRDHGMRRARGLGLDSVRIQAALVATAIDLKKLVRLLGRCGPVALAARLYRALAAITGQLEARGGPSLRPRPI